MRDQPVTNRKQKINLGSLADTHIVLAQADNQPANNIDRQNQQGGNGVAFNKFGGTVHGAIKIGLAGNFLAALGRFFSAQHASIQIGVDSHLFAGHGVQCETRRNLGHTTRTARDHHQINNNENDKDKNTDREIAGDYELAKRLNNLACGVRAFVAAAQHNARGGDVQPQPQNRGDEQKRRKA